ncbi:hypothetical protein THRCLA_05885 [Thraustotheca clavata]|uniref:Uncharacterized protein n=1 Tax=Thraustotheca clavata TaxID=74557 RepID=A0A1V9ZRN9_9STRA|nr:hypothetical protein THRCLA_05885 [Thraustotheca clavata]
MDSVRSMATSAASVARSTASSAGTMAMLGAKTAAPVIKEKGKYVCVQAGVAASIGKSTLESKLRKVQRSNAYQNLRQRLPAWNSKQTTEAEPAFAATEKEYFKVDPSKLRRSTSERRKKEKHQLQRAATTVNNELKKTSDGRKKLGEKSISVRKTSTEIAF